jgi:hypothetical protein
MNNLNELHDELKIGTLKENLASPRDSEEAKRRRFLKLRDLILTMLGIKKENKYLSNTIVENEKYRQLSNKLTIQLEADLEDNVFKNGGYKWQAEQMTKLKDSHEVHRNQAFNYCTTLKSRLKNFVETVKLY